MNPWNNIVNYSTISTSTGNLPKSNRNDSITNFLHENKNVEISKRLKDQVNDEEFDKASRIKKIEEIRSNLYEKQKNSKFWVDAKPTREYLYRMEKIKDKSVACESSELKVESRASLYRKNKIKDTGMLTEGLQLGRTTNNLETEINENGDNTITNKMVQAKTEDFLLQGKMALSPARTLSNNFSIKEKYPGIENKKVGNTSTNTGVNCDFNISTNKPNSQGSGKNKFYEINSIKEDIEDNRFTNTGVNCDFNISKNTNKPNSQGSDKNNFYEINSIKEDIEDNSIVVEDSSTTIYRRKGNRSPIRRFTGTKSTRLKFDYTQSQISKPQVEELSVNRKVYHKSGSDIIKKSFFERNAQYYPSYHYYNI